MSIFNNVFFDNGKVVIDGVHYIIGNFKVVSFLRFFILLIFCVYTLIFVDIAYSYYSNEKKEKAKLIIDIQHRVKDIFNGKSVSPFEEYLELDNLLYSFVLEMKKYEEKYEQNMTKLNLSMAFLAHDMRTPLTSILGYTDLVLNNDNIGRNNEKKYIKIIQDKANDLEKLTDQFFAYTKGQLQLEKITKIKLDLYKLLVQLKETFYPYLSEKSLDILLYVPDKTTIMADPDAIARCFGNILKNAVLYSENNGEIIVRYENNNNCDVISFENNILKASEFDVLNMFQPFYRGDYSRNHEVKGSGLGLNIAKTIIEAHQGQVVGSINGNIVSIKTYLPKS
ncbi:MAG: HAMP domain-containing sensor histidine kinase [Peptoniphilaceae bacterium]|nr:HAMP domain-containing sensor histidine kinase [Peptoniphilaceae bacterium]MDY6018616.1 HAMP domain-containing sensor histidine kinase [Anaerococcus sp.]